MQLVLREDLHNMRMAGAQTMDVLMVNKGGHSFIIRIIICSSDLREYTHADVCIFNDPGCLL